jgi:hypothetical protein
MCGGEIKVKPLPKFQRNFKGVIGLANWLRNHNHYVSRHPVNLAEGSVWPGLKNAVQRYKGGKEIVRYYLPPSLLTDISIHIELPDKYEILIPEIFNPCHKRFAVCKELCHILTDDNYVSSHNPIEQLNRALVTNKKVLGYKESDLEINPFFSGVELQTEEFCFLLALEVLIPISKRDKIIADFRGKGTTTYDIAVSLRIPESLVIFFFQSNYNVAFKRIGGIEFKLPDV